MATAKKPTRAAKPATSKRAPARKAAAPAKSPAPVAKAPVPASPAAKAADKPKKPKLVRDSFTIPKAEYAVIDVLKQRAAKAGSHAKKSELLRAGLKALSTMDDQAFTAALAAVPAIKTGRPAKS